MNRPIPATLGGFVIGFGSGLLGGALPTGQSQYVPTFLFAAVILVLLVRPRGPLRPLGRRRNAYETSALADAQELLAPVALVVAAALFGAALSASTQTYFINSLVNVSIVVALYVFIGNSGVLSFGHVSFVAVGAWTAGVLSVPAAEKSAIMPDLMHVLRERTVGNIPSLALAARGRLHLRRRRRPAADAPVRARRGHRHVRRARDHAQPPAVREPDRARPEHLLVRSRDDRPDCRRRSAPCS